MARIVHAKPLAPRKPPCEALTLVSRLIRHGWPITDKLASSPPRPACGDEVEDGAGLADGIGLPHAERFCQI
jgi:hypothetical protein